RPCPVHALGETFSGEPDAGNLQVRFDEGRVSRTTVLLSLLLYWLKGLIFDLDYDRRLVPITRFSDQKACTEATPK
ncbi:MAG TPA: hypothetical protein VG759_18640, partial [Candidatus Angelobacter sp.]|nr:hypothetical protein [Candidatus Angelobacter sp.]